MNLVFFPVFVLSRNSKDSNLAGAKRALGRKVEREVEKTVEKTDPVRDSRVSDY